MEFPLRVFLKRGNASLEPALFIREPNEIIMTVAEDTAQCLCETSPVNSG